MTHTYTHAEFHDPGTVTSTFTIWWMDQPMNDKKSRQITKNKGGNAMSMIQNTQSAPFPDKTSGVVFEMMTENTGRVLCDSGDAYGRAWQRNQTNGFKAWPEAWAETDRSEDNNGRIVGIATNTFHMLCEWLDFDSGLQKEFDAFDRRLDPGRKKADLQIMEEFAERHDQEQHYHGTYNTSNEEHSTIDAVLQFVLFDHDDDSAFCGNAVLLQYHGGCDIRWGYTRPRAFRTRDQERFLSALTSASASCSCGHVYLRNGELELDGFADGSADGNQMPSQWITGGKKGGGSGSSSSRGNDISCTGCNEKVTFGIDRY